MKLFYFSGCLSLAFAGLSLYLSYVYERDGAFIALLVAAIMVVASLYFAVEAKLEGII